MNSLRIYLVLFDKSKIIVVEKKMIFLLIIFNFSEINQKKMCFFLIWIEQ